MIRQTIAAALIGAIGIAVCGCSVTPTTPVTTMTTNESISSPATAASNRKWNQFLRIPGPAIYKYTDGVVYKTADQKLTYQRQPNANPSGNQEQEAVYKPQQESASSSQKPPGIDMESYTDAEGNGHTVTWENKDDGTRSNVQDNVTSPIIGGSYDTAHQ